MMVAMGMLGLMSACGKDPLPGEDPEEDPIEDPVVTPVRFSILGDSYSAFKGYVDPESNDIWYAPPPDNLIDVTSVEQMWWHQVAAKMDWVVEKNNSFSGSLICNFTDYSGGPYYSPHSFIRRMDGLGDPDVIFVFGGTNDVWNGAYVGDYVYSDWTESQLEQYRPALAYLFENLKRLHPKAAIYFLVHTDLADTDGGQVFVESVHTVARHYGIEYIDLRGIHKSWDHPNVQGMCDIADQVLAALQEPV